jgi:hypothetical protein
MDGRREYSPIELETLAREKGMIIELTIPYYPEQDGVSECWYHRVILILHAVKG